MTRPALRVVHSTEDWTVVLMPVRFEMIGAMRDLAPCSIAEIAERLDRRPDTLYRHMTRLVEAGFAREVGSRPTARRPERVFDLTADDFQYRPSKASIHEENESLGATAAAILDLTATTFHRATEATVCRTRAGARNVHLGCDYLWMTREEFNRMSDRFREALAHGSPRRRGASEMFMVTIAAVPVVRRTRAE